MPLTFDGRLINDTVSERPTLRDVALSTSRMARFAGHGRRWFTVLDHHLFVDQLAAMDGNTDPALHLALLIHDAHEALTGDVPSDVKPNELRERQALIDLENILPALWVGTNEQWGALESAVREYDHRALRAEAYVIGPPMFSEMKAPRFKELMLGGLPMRDDVRLLEKLIAGERLSRPAQLYLNEHAPNVREYMVAVTEAQRQVRRANLLMDAGGLDGTVRA